MLVEHHTLAYQDKWFLVNPVFNTIWEERNSQIIANDEMNDILSKNCYPWQDESKTHLNSYPTPDWS